MYYLLAKQQKKGSGAKKSKKNSVNSILKRKGQSEIAKKVFRSKKNQSEIVKENLPGSLAST
jgi:hypothetical protein